MSQVTNYTTPGTPLTMAALKIFLDDAYAAAASANRGSTAPSNPFEGMHWWDSSANPEILKRYTVAGGWVSILSVNITTGAATLASGLLTVPGAIGGTTPAPGAFTTLKQTTGKAAGAIPISDADGALTLTASTGTGAPVRATSPTLVTPALGTPASGDLSNCTGGGGGIVTTSVEDEAEIALDTGKTGRGWAMAGDNEEYINFRFTAAGVVAIISNSANAINTDTDGFLCVYDAGAGIAIKNRLGATKVIRYIVNYS